MVGRPGAQVSLTQSAVMLGLRARGRGGRDPTAPVAAPLSAFLWGSTPFLCARAKKWGGTGSRGHNPPPNKTAHTHNPKTPTSPPPKVGRGTSRPPTCSAHANGGAAEVKKGAFLWRLDTVSLGKHQRNGVESQQGPTTTSQRIGAHAETKRKGGTPGEGSPLDPLLRFNKHKGVPPAAAGGQRLCLWTPPPLKRWTKLSDALRAARKKKKKDRRLAVLFSGGGGWIRTTVGIASRFTVCPLWPLGNTPVFASLSVELVDGLEPPTC